MIASLWIADVGGVRGLAFRPPSADAIDGLRFSAGGVGSLLRTSHLPGVTPGRAVWFALWDDEAALDRVEAEPPRRVLGVASGCRMRLDPIRVYEENVSLFDDDLDADRSGHGGPVLVATVNQPRLLRIPRFLVTSVPVEQAALQRDDLRWAAGFSRPPQRFATLTVWDSGAAAAKFALGHAEDQHRRAAEAAEDKGFFAWSITVRSRPLSIEGKLGGELTGATLGL